MLKKLGIGLLAVLGLVVVALVAALFWIDSLAKAGVEYGATYALGVPTSLGGADVGLFAGSVELTQLEVKNPDGFASPHFVKLGDGKLAVGLGSLRSDTVQVPQFVLSGIDMHLEKKDGKANYQVILANLNRFESSGKGEPRPPTDQQPGKKFVIQELIIRDVVVHVDLIGIGGNLTKADVKVPEIVLKGVGTGSDKGAMVAEVTNTVLKAILLAAIEKGGGVIPADMQGELKKGLAQLDSLAKSGVKVAGDLGKQIETLGQGLEGLGKGVGKELEGVGKGIEGLFKPKEGEKK